MTKFLAYLLPLFVLGSAYAEDVKDLPPQAGITSVIVFLVIFVGTCVGFAWLVWRKSKKDKENEQKK